MEKDNKKFLLRHMLKDMMNIKIRIRVLMSMKAKGQKTDEFGEDIDESIKELKESLQMLLMAYVELCETNEKTGERTREGNELVSRTMAYSNANVDLDKLMQDGDFLDNAMNRKMRIYDEPVKKFAEKTGPIKTHSKPAKREKLPKNKNNKQPQNQNNNQAEQQAQKQAEQNQQGVPKMAIKPDALKDKQKQIADKNMKPKQKGNLIQVRSSEAKQRAKEKATRQRGMQREMSQNARVMSAPQMSR